MRLFPLALLPALLLLSSTASADLDSAKRDKNSVATFELRFGPYRPNVDAGVPSGRPYQQAFGDSTRYMIGGEVDWQALHIPHVGSLGVGGLVGWTKATANAKFSDGSGDSAEETTFSMWLLGAVAVARIDVIARETWIPLVPYLKAGPAAGFWTAANGSGTVTVDGVEGRGRTFGMFYALGGMFLLDAIDRQAAKTFAAEQGVKHSYAFFEYMLVELNGLGQTSAMHIGDRTWTAGLAMEL